MYFSPSIAATLVQRCEYLKGARDLIPIELVSLRTGAYIKLCNKVLHCMNRSQNVAY